MRPRAGAPLDCPYCGHGPMGTMSGLRGHLKSEHTDLTQRARSLAVTEARRAAGWWEVRT